MNKHERTSFNTLTRRASKMDPQKFRECFRELLLSSSNGRMHATDVVLKLLQRAFYGQEPQIATVPGLRPGKKDQLVGIGDTHLEDLAVELRVLIERNPHIRRKHASDLLAQAAEDIGSAQQILDELGEPDGTLGDARAIAGRASDRLHEREAQALGVAPSREPSRE